MADNPHPGTAAPAPAALEPHASAQPVRTGLGLCMPLLAVAVLLLLLLGALAGSLRWVLATEPGTAWLLQQLPARLVPEMVTVKDPVAEGVPLMTPVVGSRLSRGKAATGDGVAGRGSAAGVRIVVGDGNPGGR